jgi:hypothetical protein
MRKRYPSDTFPDEAGRNAHLSGEIAKALFAKVEKILTEPPYDRTAGNLGVKSPGT